MLDILRKHASSWIIKFLLGAIVLSFIFFFGYSSMRQATRGDGSDAVATVNGRPIPAAEYKFVLANNYESLKSSFKDAQVPAFVEQMAKSQTLRQLITRELELELADDLGVLVPDAALADAVRQSPQAMQDGAFDPVFYKNQFLPYFKQRFNLEYEKFLREDLMLEMLTRIFRTVDAPDVTAAGAQEKFKDYSWTFESVTIDPSKVVSKGTPASAEQVMSAAELLIKSDPAKWQGLASPLGASVVKKGPLTLRERRTLLDGQGTLDDMTEIFRLTPERPVIAKPIERGGKIYVVRLVSRNEVESNEPFWPGKDFFRSWMSRLLEKAKVVSFIKEDQ